MQQYQLQLRSIDSVFFFLYIDKIDTIIMKTDVYAIYRIANANARTKVITKTVLIVIVTL